MSGLEAEQRLKQEDDAILENTKKLCGMLSPFKCNPYRIRTSDGASGRRGRFSRMVFPGGIAASRTAGGMLQYSPVNRD